MIADYILLKYRDTFILRNLGISVLTYQLFILNNGENSEIIPVKVLPAGEEVILPTTLDGEYKLYLVRGLDVEIKQFKVYIRLQKSLIQSLGNLLCGSDCACEDCQCEEDYLRYQALFSQILSYQYLIRPYGEFCESNCLLDRFIQKALDYNKATLTGQIYDSLNCQLVTGKASASHDLLLRFASIYYAVFYYTERLLAIDLQEQTYVDVKFRWATVRTCINKSVVSLDAMKDLFTQASLECNIAPSVNSITLQFDDEIFGNNEQMYVFAVEDFTTGFVDVNGDTPNQVKIFSQASRGRLYYNNVLIPNDGIIFNIADAGKLTYKFTIQETNAAFDNIFFAVNDTNTTPKYSEMAKITLSVTQYVNKPATEVGDNAFVLNNREAKVFTVADFTSTTTPAYSDPENDPADALRVDSLPTVGTLALTNVACTVGQIIPMTAIAAGQLTYNAPNQDNSASSAFDFSLRDSGSQIFVS